jgi:hypothetical protein
LNPPPHQEPAADRAPLVRERQAPPPTLERRSALGHASIGAAAPLAIPSLLHPGPRKLTGFGAAAQWDGLPKARTLDGIWRS